VGAGASEQGMHADGSRALDLRTINRGFRCKGCFFIDAEVGDKFTVPFLRNDSMNIPMRFVFSDLKPHASL
jgi:hypothetical protein